MKRLRILTTLLSLTLILELLAGCGSQPSEPDVDDPAVPTEDSQSVEPSQEEPSQTEPEVGSDEPSAPAAGEVLSKEEASARGYDVLYGMYDYETPLSLPLTDSGESLSYWTYAQPYMAVYNVNTAETTFFVEMEKRTGVEIDLVELPIFTANENFNIMMSSGEYTDIIDGVGDYYSGGHAQAVLDEVIVDFRGFMDECMPNYTAYLNIDTDTRAGMTGLDGSIGGAALVTKGSINNVGVQIRSDWLKEQNLDMPVTYEDWHEVLTVFHNVYDSTLWLDCNATTRNNCLSAGYDITMIDMYDAFVVRDGEVLYSPMTEEYKEYITMLSQWYSEGLIYSDYFSQNLISTPDKDLVLNGKVGIWVSDTTELQSYIDGGLEIAALASPRREAGQTLHLYSPTGVASNGLAISTSCEDVELAANWLDYLYTYDGVLLCNYGVEGEGMQFTADGTPEYTELVLHNPDMITIACIATYSKYGGAGIFDAARESSGYTDIQFDAMNTWSKNVDHSMEYPDGVPQTQEETALRASLGTDIKACVSEYTLRFINGVLDCDKDWDDFMNALDALDADEYVEVHQEIYDRYISSAG